MLETESESPKISVRLVVRHPKTNEPIGYKDYSANSGAELYAQYCQHVGIKSKKNEAKK